MTLTVTTNEGKVPSNEVEKEVKMVFNFLPIFNYVLGRYADVKYCSVFSVFYDKFVRDEFYVVDT